METKGIRQDADIAAILVEDADRNNPNSKALKDLMTRLFEEDVRIYGEPSLDLLQGLFSGLMLAVAVLYRTETGQQNVDEMTRVTVEAARRYIAKVEREVRK